MTIDRQAIEILPFKPEHAPAAAEIERLSFSDPWPESEFNALAKIMYGGSGDDTNGSDRETSQPSAGVCSIYFISALYNGILCGFAGIRTVLDEGEILNIATHPDYRRHGVATRLMYGLLKYAQDIKVDNIYLEVRRSNEGAQKMYESFGFTFHGVRRDYYRFPLEDAFLYTLKRPR